MALSLTSAAFCVALAALLVVLSSKHNREASVKWLESYFPVHSRGRRISNAKTPPRSLSPENKVSNNTPAPADYKNIFPPSQRDTLPKVAENYPEPQKSKLLEGHFEETEFKKNVMPFIANFKDCGPSVYTPMGFSVDEVEALGDFPDYAELSGVPPPKPYHMCRIETALARPYRPFRWAYHQTMCRHIPSSRFEILF